MKDNSFNEIGQYWRELAELNEISNNKMNQLYNKFMTTKEFKEWENKDRMDIIFSEEMFNKFMNFYKKEMGKDMIINKETKFEDASLKLPNLDKLLAELNAPIEIEGEEPEGQFNFKYRLNGDFLELYDEYENYTIDYEEDMNYMMEGLSSEFGADFDYYEDDILPRIEEALKKDGFTEPLEWENNVVMTIELPNKMKVKDSRNIKDGHIVYHYKGYEIEIDEDFEEAEEFGYYVPEEPWDLYSPSGKYIGSFKSYAEARKYVDGYVKDALAPKYMMDGDLLEVIDYLQDEPYGLDIKQVNDTTYKTADIYFRIDHGRFVIYDDNGELIEVCDTSDELIETILDHNDWHDDDFDWDNYFESTEGEFEKQEEFDKAAAEELAYRTEHAKGYDSIKDVKPKKGESKKDFIARFMKETVKEYPDEKQRAAIAYSYWDKRNVKDSNGVEYSLEWIAYNKLHQKIYSNLDEAKAHLEKIKGNAEKGMPIKWVEIWSGNKLIESIDFEDKKLKKDTKCSDEYEVEERDIKLYKYNNDKVIHFIEYRNDKDRKGDIDFDELLDKYHDDIIYALSATLYDDPNSGLKDEFWEQSDEEVREYVEEHVYELFNKYYNQEYVNNTIKNIIAQILTHKYELKSITEDSKLKKDRRYPSRSEYEVSPYNIDIIGYKGNGVVEYIEYTRYGDFEESIDLDDLNEDYHDELVETLMYCLDEDTNSGLDEEFWEQDNDKINKYIEDHFDELFNKYYGDKDMNYELRNMIAKSLTLMREPDPDYFINDYDPYDDY